MNVFVMVKWVITGRTNVILATFLACGHSNSQASFMVNTRDTREGCRHDDVVIVSSIGIILGLCLAVVRKGFDECGLLL